MSSVLNAKPATTSSRAGRLAEMTPGRGKLTEAEAVEAIRANRRGIPLKKIGRALGKSEITLRSMLGTWALRHAILPEPDAK